MSESETERIIRRPCQCTELGCVDDVAPYTGRGRPPSKCPAHLALKRKYREHWENKRSGVLQGTDTKMASSE